MEGREKCIILKGHTVKLCVTKFVPWFKMYFNNFNSFIFYLIDVECITNRLKYSFFLERK